MSTFEQIREKIDKGASLLNEVATELQCHKERNMIHDAAAKLFLVAAGEKREERDYE